MDQWNSVDEILDFAIKNEEQAETLYNDLAEKADSRAMATVFKDFAREERGHKAKLLGAKQSGNVETEAGKITNLKIGDYLVDVEPAANLNYQDTLILAMKQEKAAFRLYIDLAAATADPDLCDLLLALAQEEAKHKLRFEVEYDEHILTEN